MLTKILRDHPDLAQQLADLVPLGSLTSAPLPLQAYPNTDHYALVGTAFDYLVRFELERRNSLAKDRIWVASTAVGDVLPSMVSSGVCDRETARLYHAVLKEALEFHSWWVADRRFGGMPRPKVEAAAKVVLCLAKIDPLFRTGTIVPDVNVFDTADVSDIVNLYSIAPWERLGGAQGERVLLNPDFGRWSDRLDGADADLVVGSTLIDLKTSKYNDISKHFPQLVGYFMLGELYRQDDPSYPSVERAGIYWCRHGYVETFDAKAVLLDPRYERAVERLLSTADSVVASVRERRAGTVP